jgi:hypothetical protein
MSLMMSSCCTVRLKRRNALWNRFPFVNLNLCHVLATYANLQQAFKKSARAS